MKPDIQPHVEVVQLNTVKILVYVTTWLCIDDTNCWCKLDSMIGFTHISRELSLMESLHKGKKPIYITKP